MEQEYLHHFPQADPKVDLQSLVEHSESVADTEKLEDVYHHFEVNGRKFAGVVSNGKLVGIASRSKIGFLLGSRYGFSIYGRKPMRSQMLERPLLIRVYTPLLKVLEEAFSRDGDDFHDDVALVDAKGGYLGMIPMQRLVRLQSQLISEKTRLAEQQQQVLAAKNARLFASLHQLRQSNGRFDILFENSALGVALLSPSGEVEALNKHAESLLGIRDEEGDAPLLKMMETASRDEFQKLLQEHEKQSDQTESRQMEFRLNLHGRGRRLFKFFSSWIKETGQVCVLMDDITDQRKLELKVAQEERSATLDTLAGGVAHEINNKLAPILGFSELLLAEARNSGKSPETVQYCNIIRDCAMDSSKIITQLLQVSRPPSSEKQCCDLREIAEQVVAILRFQIRQSEAEMVFQLPRDPVWVSVDTGQVKQVVINLLINSLQAVEHRKKRKVVVSVAREGENTSLQIEDTGHGIKSEHLKRVFDPFFTTKTFNRGTGLGLSICASIVQRHGGDIFIESTTDVGTTVKVVLPAATLVPLPSPKSAESEPKETHSEEDMAGIHVLVVDDEEYVACAVQEALRRKMACSVERAVNGLQAIERLRRREFDLVISDVRMPGMDGFGLYEWVQAHRPRLTSRFLFITGDAGNAELHEKLEKCGAPLLRKPFALDKLVEESQKMLIAAETQSALRA